MFYNMFLRKASHFRVTESATPLNIVTSQTNFRMAVIPC